MADENDELSAALKNLSAVMVQMQQGMQTMGTTLTQVVEKLNTPTDGKGSDKGGAEDFSTDDVDLERLDRKQFLGLIMKGVSSEISKAVKPLTDQISSVDVTTTKLSAQQQVEKILADPKNKDFNDWVPEMKAILKDNPTLSIKAALTLARSDNPTKAKELSDKYKLNEEPAAGNDDDKNKGGDKGKIPPKDTKAGPTLGYKPKGNKSKESDDDVKGGEKKKPGYGGMTPSGGAEEEHNSNMDPSDAAAKALDEASARHPGAAEYLK